VKKQTLLRRGGARAAALLTILFIVALGGCEDFFSTSWGAAFARDPADMFKNVTVTAGNVDDLLEASKGNPNVAKEALKKIKGAIKGDLSAGDLKLQAAALTAATEASGVASAIVSQAASLVHLTDLSEEEQEAKAKEVMDSVLKKAQNLDVVAQTLTEEIKLNTGSAWERDELIASNFADTDDETLFVAAMVLILADAKTNDMTATDYIDSKKTTLFSSDDSIDVINEKLDSNDINPEGESAELKLAWTLAQMVDPTSTYGKMLKTMGIIQEAPPL
jgi:hypothetical protein